MNPETQADQPPSEILFESDLGFQYATTGQRFLNWLIDNLLMQLGLSFLTGMVVAVVFQAINPALLERMITEGTTENLVFALVVGYVNYVFYYTVCEKLCNGYTLGKLITGTKAVRLDGTPLTFKDALLRSLCRIVPFEVLSGFGTPWHDSWTNTTVIKSR